LQFIRNPHPQSGVHVLGFSDARMDALAAEKREEKIVMIDATYLKEHRTATNRAAKKGIEPCIPSLKEWKAPILHQEI